MDVAADELGSSCQLFEQGQDRIAHVQGRGVESIEVDGRVPELLGHVTRILRAQQTGVRLRLDESLLDADPSSHVRLPPEDGGEALVAEDPDERHRGTSVDPGFRYAAQIEDPSRARPAICGARVRVHRHAIRCNMLTSVLVKARGVDDDTAECRNTRATAP